MRGAKRNVRRSTRAGAAPRRARRPNVSSPPAALSPREAAAAAQRYRLLFDRSLAGIYRTTLDGRILDCNESLAAMLGYSSREEVLRHGAVDLYFQAADRKAFLAHLRQTGTLTNSELRLRRKDGSPIDILENVSLMRDEDGKLTLIEGTMVDITQRKRAEEALRDSEQRYRMLAEDLRRLMQHLQTVREEERARIARELHDELGQALTVLNLDLHWLRGRSWHGAETTQTRITALCALVNTTIQAVRRICADLRPPMLDDFGLPAAIEWQAREFQARTRVPCELSLPKMTPALPGECATAVFRILQESLTNIARHARATRVRVSLRVRADALLLKVTDNGIGIAAKKLVGPRSLGLVGMRERALRWGGHVEIIGRPGRGTTILLQLPIPPTAAEPAS